MPRRIGVRRRGPTRQRPAILTLQENRLAALPGKPDEPLALTVCTGIHRSRQELCGLNLDLVKRVRIILHIWKAGVRRNGRKNAGMAWRGTDQGMRRQRRQHWLRGAARRAEWPQVRLQARARPPCAQHKDVPRVVERGNLAAVGAHESHCAIERGGEEIGYRAALREEALGLAAQ